MAGTASRRATRSRAGNQIESGSATRCPTVSAFAHAPLAASRSAVWVSSGEGPNRKHSAFGPRWSSRLQSRDAKKGLCQPQPVRSPSSSRRSRSISKRRSSPEKVSSMRRRPVSSASLSGSPSSSGRISALSMSRRLRWREQVVFAQGLDLVAPELGAHGRVHAVAEHVEDAAADGKRPHLLAQGLLPVAHFAKARAQCREVGGASLAQDERLARQTAGLRQSLSEGGERRHDQAGAASREVFEGGEATLESGAEGLAPFVGLEFDGGEGEDASSPRMAPRSSRRRSMPRASSATTRGAGPLSARDVSQGDRDRGCGCVESGDFAPGFRRLERAERREQSAVV